MNTSDLARTVLVTFAAMAIGYPTQPHAEQFCKFCAAPVKTIELEKKYIEFTHASLGLERELKAGGSFDASKLSAECHGFLRAKSPNVEVISDTDELYMWANSEDEPVTLVVLDPNDRWRCSDISLGAPIVAWDNAPNGKYRVWVGVQTYNGYRINVEFKAGPEPPSGVN